MESRQVDGGPIMYTTSYLVDDSGLLVEEQVRVGAELTIRTTYKRDASHRVIEKCTFQITGKTETPDGCAKQHYQGTDTLEDTNEEVAASGKVAARTRFKYDASGREIERTLSLADGKSSLQTRTYDAVGRLDTIKIEDPLSGLTFIRHVYAKDGALTRETVEGPDGDNNKLKVFVVRTYPKPCKLQILLDAD